MSAYMLLCNFTDQGVRTIKEMPQRRAAARELGKKLGVDIKAGYLAIGTYDLIIHTEATDDGLHGEEGTFLICSFWLVSALSEIGEAREAEHLCERLLSYASSLDLYGEELEASSGRHLGNYPQAFTHLALINAVTHVISDQQGT